MTENKTFFKLHVFYVSVCVYICVCHDEHVRSENNLRLSFPQWAKILAKHGASPFLPQNRGKDVCREHGSACGYWDLNSALHDYTASILNY